MKVELDRKSATEAFLTVKLFKEDYQAKVDKTVKDYGKKANLKGFRPGHVPPQVIYKMYGKSILVDEVNHLLGHAVSDYIRDNKLRVVGDPAINREKSGAIDWDKQTDFEFEYELGLASDFEVDINSLAPQTKYSVKADDAAVEKAIKDLQERFSEHVHPDKSALGDTLYGELKQELSEFSTKTAIPTNRVSPKSQPTFEGLEKGSTVTFDIKTTFEDEAAIAHVTGKKKAEASELDGEFTFQVEDISRTVSAELNQGLFDKSLGEGVVSNEEEFKQKLAELIQENYVRESEAVLRRDTDNGLLNMIPIELPEDFLKEWLESTNEGKFTREQIDNEFEDFKKSLKLNLIKTKFAEGVEIKIDPNELLEFTKNMVRSQFGMYGSDASMEETIQKIAAGYLADKERGNYQQVYNQIFDNKVWEAIRAQIKIEEKEVGVEEFEKIASAKA